MRYGADGDVTEREAGARAQSGERPANPGSLPSPKSFLSMLKESAITLKGPRGNIATLAAHKPVKVVKKETKST